MHGHGTMSWISGDRCKAYWVNNEMNGVGIYTWANGIVGIMGNDKTTMKVE